MLVNFLFSHNFFYIKKYFIIQCFPPHPKKKKKKKFKTNDLPPFGDYTECALH